MPWSSYMGCMVDEHPPRWDTNNACFDYVQTKCDQAMIGDETDIYIYIFVFPRAHCCTSLRPSSELWPLWPSAGVVWADILTKILHRHGCIPSKEICSGVKICHWLACYSRHSSLCECSTNCRWVFFPVSGSKIPWLSTPMLQPS